jgi:hypothetical protein
MSDIEKEVKKFTKQQLMDYANRLEDIILLIDPSLISRHPSSFYKSSLKIEVARYCQDTAAYLFSLEVERHSTFFWKDGSLDSIKQELCKIITEEHESVDIFVDGFVDTDYFEPFLKQAIMDHKIKLMGCELYKVLFHDDRERIELDKEEVIKKWERYKDIHQKVDLFDDDELF